MNNGKTMKELPESERPDEKCLDQGPEILSDAELLAVIVRCGSAGVTSVELAASLLRLLDSRGGLGALCDVSSRELMAIQGIGKVKAVQLQCIGELTKRISRQYAKQKIRLDSSASIADYFMEDMRHLGQEEIRVAFFDTRNHLLATTLVSRGTVNASMITPREVFVEAVKNQAVYLVLVHNHPSGNPAPSRDDYLLTERMIQAGRIMEIEVMDHIIIGDNCYDSLRERGFFE